MIKAHSAVHSAGSTQHRHNCLRNTNRPIAKIGHSQYSSKNRAGEKLRGGRQRYNDEGFSLSEETTTS